MSVELRPLELVAGAGPSAPARRSGGSCVSHGTSGRNGVFAEDCFAGWEPRKAKGATPVSWPGRSGVVKGAIVFVPPPPSDAELLAVRVAGAALARDAGEAVGGLLVDLAPRAVAVAVARSRWGSRVLLHGMTTLLKQEESARLCSRNGSVSWLSAARSGTVGPQVLDQAAQLVLGDQLAELADPRVRVVERRVRWPSPPAAPRGRRRAGPGSPG